LASRVGVLKISSQSKIQNPKSKIGLVSAGQVVKAMIINCMGFLSAPLYLFSQSILDFGL